MYSLSVGGAEASQNGFGDLMPTNSLEDRPSGQPPWAALPTSARWIEFGGVAAVGDGNHGEVVAAGNAVAARPDAGHVGAALGIDLDAAALQLDPGDGAVERLAVEGLADRLEHHVGLEREGLAGADKAAVFLARIFKLDAGDTAGDVGEADRPRVEEDGDAVGLGKLAFVTTGAHALRGAAIDDGDLLGAEPLRLGGDVDGGHAAADHDHAAADGQRGQILRLAEPGDVIDRILDAGHVLAGEAERIDAAEADGEEDGVEVLPELAEGELAAEHLAGLDVDAADPKDEFDLAGGEIFDGLVGGDAVFVEAADLRPGVEDDDVVAVERQAMGAGEAGRPAADDGDAFSGERGARERLAAGLDHHVGGVALQFADPDRLALGDLAHADLLAQRLGRADAGAHAAEDVLLRESCARRRRDCR